MKYHEYSPHSILQHTVKCFWILETTYPVGGTQDVTPDGCVELAFNFGSPYVPLSAAPASPLPVAFIIGFQRG